MNTLPTDTEVYVLPALLLLDPALAQTLLQYRLERLGAAEAKARGAAPPVEGAMFPWESAATGAETAAGGGDVDYAGRAVVRVVKNARAGGGGGALLPFISFLTIPSHRSSGCTHK